MKKYCVKCGKQFEAVGREVICPACKQAAAEESKKAAVLRAKRASWNGESVPVRISGRASTLIRHYGAESSLSFAESLDALLKSTPYFAKKGIQWQDIVPYKSRRMKKSAVTEAQDVQEVKPKEEAQEVKPQEEEAKTTKTSKTSTAAKAAAKTASKAAGKAASKK